MSSIAAYYGGKSVLVTGATGFIARVLVEKLLRASPDVEAIYILVRPKTGRSMQERVSDMLSCKLFDWLRDEQPGFEEKVIAIRAELSQPNLAISTEDTHKLLASVNIIFHCAATIRFDEPLKNVLQLNVMATQKLLELARQMPKLEAFIYLSTAYSNCNRRCIKEVVYPPFVEPKKLMDAVQWMGDSIIREITPRLIGDWPNTYTYSKALAEFVVQQESGNIPIAIVRPSVVGPIWHEPFPGWIDRMNGLCAIVIAIGKGILRSIKVKYNALADIIPVDVVINLTLAAGWHTAVQRPKETLVYNCTSGGFNPVCWGDTIYNFVSSMKRIPTEKTFRRPNTSVTSSTLVNKYWNFVSHKVPALLYDCFLRLTGREPGMMKIFSYLAKALMYFEFFSSRSWEWSLDNVKMLMEELSPEDRKEFNFDVRQLNWAEYADICCIGGKKYLLKEDMSGLPAARRHLRKLGIIYYAFVTVLLFFICLIFITTSQ